VIPNLDLKYLKRLYLESSNRKTCMRRTKVSYLKCSIIRLRRRLRSAKEIRMKETRLIKTVNFLLVLTMEKEWLQQLGLNKVPSCRCVIKTWICIILFQKTLIVKPWVKMWKNLPPGFITTDGISFKLLDPKHLWILRVTHAVQIHLVGLIHLVNITLC
jgi:hypothetical protein